MRELRVRNNIVQNNIDYVIGTISWLAFLILIICIPNQLDAQKVNGNEYEVTPELSQTWTGEDVDEYFGLTELKVVPEPVNQITNNWGSDTEQITKILEFEEGFSSRPYLCSEGYVTIGYGTKLYKAKGGNPEMFAITVDRDIAGKLLLKDVSSLEVRLSQSKVGKVFDSLDSDRRIIIISMAYQMGVSGITDFESMWKHAASKNWERMADEAMDSVWAKQTPNRAGRHARVLAGESIISIYK